MRTRLPWLLVFSAAVFGCGTTRWSDTSRTATEQLLLSDAMDRAVSLLDFRALAGRRVFLDTKYLEGITDAPYLISSLRQQMLASGCIVKTEREEADYVVEARAGTVGTDRNDLLYGIPQTKIPVAGALPGIPTQIPEIALAKRTNQRGVAKIALFAYNRTTGRPVWQSGAVPAESKAKDLWVFGAGPFQHGNIYDGTMFAGNDFDVPLIRPGTEDGKDAISVADEAYFVEPEGEIARRPEDPKSEGAKPERPKSQGPKPARGAAPARQPAPPAARPNPNGLPPLRNPYDGPLGRQGPPIEGRDADRMTPLPPGPR